MLEDFLCILLRGSVLIARIERQRDKVYRNSLSTCLAAVFWIFFLYRTVPIWSS